MRAARILVLWAIFIVTRAFAGPNDKACRQTLKDLIEKRALPMKLEDVPDGAECRVVSDVLLGDLVDRAKGRASKLAKRPLSNADVEPTPMSSGTQGGPAQATAVPTVQPTPLAAASLSTVTTNAGSKVITEVKLNPLGLFTVDGPGHSWASRTFDVVLDIPTSSATALENGNVPSFDYLGVRVRANFLGYKSGSAVFENAKEEFGKVLAGIGMTGDQIEKSLNEAPDVAKCVAEVQQALDAGATRVGKGDCGEDIGLDALNEPEAVLQQALAKARHEADSRYFGLELRSDFGDPRFTGLNAQRGTRILGGLSFGHQAVGGLDMSAQIRGRLGVSYTRIQYSGTTTWSIDGALAAVLNATVGGGRHLIGSFGFEGRGAPSQWGPTDTNYLNFVLGVTVPVSESGGITVGTTLPLITNGDQTRKPILTVTGAWELLLRSFASKI